VAPEPWAVSAALVDQVAPEAWAVSAALVDQVAPEAWAVSGVLVDRPSDRLAEANVRLARGARAAHLVT
jgi:hypothetical protein